MYSASKSGVLRIGSFLIRVAVVAHICSKQALFLSALLGSGGGMDDESIHSTTYITLHTLEYSLDNAKWIVNQFSPLCTVIDVSSSYARRGRHPLAWYRWRVSGLSVCFVYPSLTTL